MHSEGGAVMSQFFKRRGIRIRKYHLFVYRLYLFILLIPFFLGIGFYCYKKIYPIVWEMYLRERFDYKDLIIPVTILLLLLLIAFAIVLIIRKIFFLKGGVFLRAYQRQMIAKMISSRRLYEKKTVKKSDGKTKEKVIYPPVYYQHKGAMTSITVPTDGGKNHDQFEKIGKIFEKMFIADLTDEEYEQGFTKYSYLVDVVGNRISIDDVSTSDNKIRLMKGTYWDYCEVPHMLITGGTGGGKTYFLYTLIKAFMEVGTVDICDPKQADLMDLKELEAFKGHVFTGTEWITKCLKNAEREMNDRYSYMKSLPNYVSGKNFAYYNIPPHFLIIDEWVAFFGTLDYKEQEIVRKHLQQLVLKARQAGVFIVLAMQRPDAEYLGGGIRDNMLFRVSLGKLTESGYHMTFGDENKNKVFINKRIKGRGYVDDGSAVVREFYSPLVPRGYDFMKEFAKFDRMIVADLTEKKVNN